VHDFLCTANEAALTTYNIGRTQIETIKRRLKKIVATETHRTATGAICVHNLGIRYELGGELIVFLRRSKSGTEPKQQTATSGLSYGAIPLFYLVMYEGFSALRTDYECVFDGKEIAQQCDDGVEVNTSQVILPKSIRTFPSSTKGAFSKQTNWVRKNVFIAYLQKLSK
jgi:hypothetical protein